MRAIPANETNTIPGIPPARLEQLQQLWAGQPRLQACAMTGADLIAALAVSSSRQQAEKLRATEQLQEALELASMGDVQPGKSASIKSISDSIQSSMSCCFSSQISRRSASGSRRQLSIRKNERKRDSDEPDAPLLLEGEDVAREVDVDIGKEKGHQADQDAGECLHDRKAVERQTELQPTISITTVSLITDKAPTSNKAHKSRLSILESALGNPQRLNLISLGEDLGKPKQCPKQEPYDLARRP